MLSNPTFALHLLKIWCSDLLESKCPTVHCLYLAPPFLPHFLLRWCLLLAVHDHDPIISSAQSSCMRSQNPKINKNLNQFPLNQFSQGIQWSWLESCIPYGRLWSLSKTNSAEYKRICKHIYECNIFLLVCSQLFLRTTKPCRVIFYPSSIMCTPSALYEYRVQYVYIMCTCAKNRETKRLLQSPTPFRILSFLFPGTSCSV